MSNEFLQKYLYVRLTDLKDLKDVKSLYEIASIRLPGTWNPVSKILDTLLNVSWIYIFYDFNMRQQLHKIKDT